MLYCNNDMAFDPERPECMECGEHDETIPLYQKCQDNYLALISVDFNEEEKLSEEEEEEDGDKTPDAYDVLTKEIEREI